MDTIHRLYITARRMLMRARSAGGLHGIAAFRGVLRVVGAQPGIFKFCIIAPINKGNGIDYGK